MSTLWTALEVVLCILGAALGSLRWLRVAQREHYVAGSTTRFALRWWTSTPLNALLVACGVAATVASLWARAFVIIPAVVAGVAPLGLSLKGRTSPLAWTRRLRTLAFVTAVIAAVVLAVGTLGGAVASVAAAVALLMPVVVDGSARVLVPVEERAARRFVDQAARRLADVSPTVVAITGSYGKTSTKNHLHALIAGDRVVVASPRSFNNRAGLARAINEHLAPGTELFIAEMGTYGPGEIAELCRWCPPEVSVITAIGPVHLERFGSLDVTLAAKSEIAEPASVVVLNIDDERLAGLADRLEREGKRVVRAGSTRTDADVVVRTEESSWAIDIHGATVAASPVLVGVQPTNVACAIGAAIAVGLDPGALGARVASLTTIENRLGVIQAPSGVVVVDDTFNSNPAGANAALDVLDRLQVSGRRVVVTPGMVELGDRQRHENELFARRAATVADVVVIVGRTNSRALRRGAEQAGRATVVSVKHREDAVSWVREALGGGDAVLYENDLPDNYP